MVEPSCETDVGATAVDIPVHGNLRLRRGRSSESDGHDVKSNISVEQLTGPRRHPDHKALESLQHWIQHASVYTISGKPVPPWVWERIKTVLEGVRGG